jgi:hypothetical protein
LVILAQLFDHERPLLTALQLVADGFVACNHIRKSASKQRNFKPRARNYAFAQLLVPVDLQAHAVGLDDGDFDHGVIDSDDVNGKLELFLRTTLQTLKHDVHEHESIFDSFKISAFAALDEAVVGLAVSVLRGLGGGIPDDGWTAVDNAT